VNDLRGYVSRHVLAHFLPAEPAALLRVVPAPAPRTPFAFLRDGALAARLAADWHEAQDVWQVRGWKSCVLLCGGILETLLRAVETPCEATAAACGAGAEAALSLLVHTAVKRGLLPEPLALTPAIEAYRSLALPTGGSVGRQDAEKALQAVRTCLRHLATQADL
jgi:hypothetical protein